MFSAKWLCPIKLRVSNYTISKTILGLDYVALLDDTERFLQLL